MGTSFEKLVKHANDISINFVTAEIDLAVRLLNTAADTHSEVWQMRLRREAQEAYDTVLRCIPHVHLSASEKKTVEELLGKVRSRLEEAKSVLRPEKAKPVRRRSKLGF